MASARAVLGGAGWAPLRVLLPAWRFFETASEAPRLYLRAAAPGAELGDWVPMEGPPRHFTDAWFAPWGNLSLACHAAVERLVSELEELAEGEDPRDLVSYALVGRIAHAQLPAAVRDQGAHFQWKVVAGQGAARVDIVVSAVLPA